MIVFENLIGIIDMKGLEVLEFNSTQLLNNLLTKMIDAVMF